MSEAGQEFSGKSVDEAIAAGLRSLGLRSNQVQVEIINKGSRGLFGLGSEPAVVKLIPLHLVAPAKAETTPAAETIEEEVSQETSVAAAFPEATPVTTSFSNKKIASEGITSVEPSSSDAEIAEDAEEISTSEEEGETETTSVEMLSRMIELLGFKVTVEPVWKDSDDEHDKRVLWLEIHGKNLSPLIGRRGDTLENIQYLLRMMVNQRLHRWNDIVVDVDQYRIRRAEQISQLANRMADQAISAGRAMALEPMPPNERRIVHMTLRDHPHVYTQSSGDGERRKVYIVPKN